ncbi:MAG: hypothetical protein QX189_04070, partial [Methylococcales bacterium]
MLKISGSSALSDFRVNNLLVSLQAIEPSITSVTARFMHFVGTERDLDDNSLVILKQLLAYGGDSIDNEPQGETLLVVPRSGT